MSKQSGYFTAVVTKTGTNPVYQWLVNGNPTGKSSSSFTINTLNNGDVVSCTVSNPSQCVVPVASNAVSVTITPLPSVSFPGDLTIPYGKSVKLFPNTIGNIASYSWSPAIGLSDATAANPIASPKSTTTYTLTIITTSGCTAVATVTVKITTVVSNAFTPNGDGINDQWDIPILTYYPTCHVNIFDRHGARIFSSIGYPKAWDGTYNGKPVPDGVYYYVIEANGDSLSGSVTVIR